MERKKKSDDWTQILRRSLEDAEIHPSESLKKKLKTKQNPDRIEVCTRRCFSHVMEM